MERSERIFLVRVGDFSSGNRLRPTHSSQNLFLFIKMLKEIEDRHGLVSGFETQAPYDAHTDEFPYDNLMLKLYYQIQNQEKEKEEKKEREKSADQVTHFFLRKHYSPMNSKGQVRSSFRAQVGELAVVAQVVRELGVI
jgi:hypothetical protein